MAQISGRLKDEADYGSKEYFQLAQQIAPLRRSFRVERDAAARKEIAGEEIKAWLSFLEARKEMLKENPDFQFSMGTQKMLKESFDRVRERESAQVRAKDLIEMHGTYAKAFKLRIPIHPRNLAQMIHPHQGYMASFKEGRSFAWKELVKVYETQIVSSYEKSEGRFLLGEELSALAFWQLQDENSEGHLDWAKTRQLMHAFRFDDIETETDF